MSEIQMNNWQDVMVENHGLDWALKTYEKIDVFKMAEKIDALKRENCSMKTSKDKAAESAIALGIKCNEQNDRIKELEEAISHCIGRLKMMVK